MTQDNKHMIEMKLEDMIDDIHDYYCVLHERGIRLEPSEYTKMVLSRILQMQQDLADEFDEEVDN